MNVGDGGPHSDSRSGYGSVYLGNCEKKIGANNDDNDPYYRSSAIYCYNIPLIIGINGIAISGSVIVQQLLVVLMIYGFVWMFVLWYISGEVGSLRFRLTMLLFIGRMLAFLLGNRIMLVWRWECIGVMSILLIGFWQRGEANGAACAAILYNRLGDVFLLGYLVGIDMWYWRLVAVIRKSALWILRYWLPIAMERPTPVSSLLHSSTMVVAGVILGILISIPTLAIRIIRLICITLYSMRWYDVKKMIALSTSVHLAVMISLLGLGLYGMVFLHVILHGLVKASAFVTSGILIHGIGTQDRRDWTVNNEVLLIIIVFMVLIGVGGSTVGMSKEELVIGMIGLWIMVSGWMYSKKFFNTFGRVKERNMVIPFNWVLVIICGGGVIEIMRLVGMVTLLTMMRVRSMSTIYVMNK